MRYGSFTSRPWVLLLLYLAFLTLVALVGAMKMKSNQPVSTSKTAPAEMRSVSREYPLLGHAPRLGTIELGAFAPEAATRSGLTHLSLSSLDDDAVYTQYRAAVRTAYGADLADMNYLAVGKPGWESRDIAFHHWLFRAARYGDPTIAIEPLGNSEYGAFEDTPEMERLRAIFRETDRAGIIVWVRFASEANLRLSDYSVYNDPAKIRQYRRAVHWFRGYMPRSVRLVFSPLINTAYLRAPRQIATLQQMYVRGDYDRIGGTLYATTKLHLHPAYTWYHSFMRRLDPDCPFQICELGGIYTRRAEVEDFLRALSENVWPDVKRVNLFAGDLNTTAVNEHGHFGFIEPGASVSYIAEFFGASAVQTRGNISTEASPLRGTEKLTLVGTVSQVDLDKKLMVMQVHQIVDSLGETITLSPSRRKRVLIGPETSFHSDTESRTPRLHESVQADGWDNGTGTPLHAARIWLLAKPQ